MLSSFWSILMGKDPKTVVRYDGPLLRWLMERLKSRVTKPKEHWKPSQDEWACEMAIRAYALTVGSIRWEAAHGVPEPADEIDTLERWMNDRLDAARRTDTTGLYMTRDVADDIISKLTWLETPEGLKALEKISKACSSPSGDSGRRTCE
jgi:hypothetical protein